MGDDISLDLSILPKELRLILLLLTMKEDQKLLPDTNDLFVDIDWNVFIELAGHHSVYPIIYLQLKKAKEPLVPKHVFDFFQKEYRINTFQMLYLSREMENVCRLFTENNVRVLLLKGPILAADLYGDISYRKSVDLDIFVSLNDLDRVDKFLVEHGYEKEEFFSTELDDWKWRIHHLNYVHPQSRIRLEIHWRLHPGPGKEPSFNELWKRKRKSSITNYPIYYLEKEDLFLFLVTHGARHGWSRISWLMDIDRIVKQKLDLGKLKKLMQKYQCLHVGGQALILSSQLFKTPIVEETETFKVGKRSWRLAQQALFYIKQMVNLHVVPVPKNVSKYHSRYLFALMSKRQKVVFILSTFYPYHMDAETLPLPRRFYFLYFPLRPLLWALRKIREFAWT